MLLGVKKMPRKHPLIVSGFLLLLACAILFLPGRIGNPDFRLTMIDVGQGDSFLLACDGEYALVDGGGELMDVTGSGSYAVLPYLNALGIDSLKYCINTHPDADHIGGLFVVMDQMPVESFIHGGFDDVVLLDQLIALAKTRNIDCIATDEPTVLELGRAKLTLWMYRENAGETETNSGSTVVYISFGGRDILLTGDLEGESQQKLLSSGLDLAAVDVLQIPHHGSKNSYDENWYAAFSPAAVLISVGADNSYGHPYRGVTEYWQRHGANVYRSDMDGSVEISINENGEIEFKTFVGDG
jgi:competence protein ComEC